MVPGLQEYPGTQRGTCSRLAPAGSDPKGPCLSLSVSSSPAQGSEKMPGILPSCLQSHMQMGPCKRGLWHTLDKTLALLGPCETLASSAQEKKMRADSLKKRAQISLRPLQPGLCNPHGSTWAGLGRGGRHGDSESRVAPASTRWGLGSRRPISFLPVHRWVS